MTARKLVVLAAGGTGGHFFPAEALARELLMRGYRVAIVSDRRGHTFADRLAGVAVHRIRAGRFDAGIAGKIVGIAELALGTLEARRLLRGLNPACAVGFGGYPSVPTMLAAAQLGLPAVIHEQNAIMGRANRLLARRVDRIATSFAETAGVRPENRARIVTTGNPVRPAVAAMRGSAYPTFGSDVPFRILVLGGSQGARIMSDVVPAALALLPQAVRAALEVTEQARPEDLEAVRRAHAENRVASETASFFEDVPARLAAAHLVISRAGASSVAEIAIIGRPAILVPYANAAEDHQSANAQAVVRSGAAWIMSEPEFTPRALAERLQSLISQPEQLARAAAASFALGRPLAARALADVVSELAGGEANGDRPVYRENAA
jgi:UDP-N-acetylglucosamine--N-acetylmuramyl-(pentapeptide) pyrophosphoryl-undecaprenol N-acetylglucosamine transferase